MLFFRVLGCRSMRRAGRIVCVAAAVVVALVYELLRARRAARRQRLVEPIGSRSEARIGRPMEESILGVTKLVNALFGKPALALLTAPAHSARAIRNIPSPTTSRWNCWCLPLRRCFSVAAGRGCRWTIPAARSRCMEALLRNSMALGVRDCWKIISATAREKYLPMIGSIGMFVLICNLISVVPGLSSPTAEKVGAAGLRDRRVSLLQLVPGCGSMGRSITASISWVRSGAFAAHGDDGIGQPSGAAAFAHGSSLGQHDGERIALRDFPGADAGLVSFRRKAERVGLPLAPVPLLAP